MRDTPQCCDGGTGGVRVKLESRLLILEMGTRYELIEIEVGGSLQRRHRHVLGSFVRSHAWELGRYVGRTSSGQDER